MIGDIRRLNQRDGGASEPCPLTSRQAPHGFSASFCDPVELFATHVIVVSKRVVALIHQDTEARVILV